MAGHDWFFDLFGISEDEFVADRGLLQVSGEAMHCPKTGQAFGIGRFTTLSLRELRDQASAIGSALRTPGAKRLKVDFVYGDVSTLHADPDFRHATFQAASQFNCLEFISPYMKPEDGITCYARDKTQGPACSVACGAATAYRNYFHAWAARDGTRLRGQTAQHMINNLEGLEDLLAPESGGTPFFTVQGGYTQADATSLARLNARFAGRFNAPDSPYRDAVRLGVHEDVQVTSHSWGRRDGVPQDQLVTQVFGSACSVAYSSCKDTGPWEPLARLVLEASYEAVLYVAILSAIRHRGAAGSRRAVLTLLGGGVFGNDPAWILGAIRRACDLVADCPLEVLINVMSPSALHPADTFALRRLFPG